MWLLSWLHQCVHFRMRISIYTVADHKILCNCFKWVRCSCNISSKQQGCDIPEWHADNFLGALFFSAVSLRLRNRSSGLQKMNFVTHIWTAQFFRSQVKFFKLFTFMSVLKDMCVSSWIPGVVMPSSLCRAFFGQCSSA